MVRRASSIVRRREPPDLRAYAAYPPESVAGKRFYNIGAGAFGHPCWTNLDLPNPQYRAVQRDFIAYDAMSLQPLPLPSSTAEIVYTANLVEHVSDEAVDTLLREAHRVLRPGGVLRVVTAPDAELDHRAWRRGDRSHFWFIEEYGPDGPWRDWYTMPLTEASTTQVYLFELASQCSLLSPDPTARRKFSDHEVREVFDTLPFEEALSFFTGQCSFNPQFAGNHMNWWTHEKLERAVRRAGFGRVERSPLGRSGAEPLRDTRYFDGPGRGMPVIVEAIR